LRKEKEGDLVEEEGDLAAGRERAECRLYISSKKGRVQVLYRPILQGPYWANLWGLYRPNLVGHTGRVCWDVQQLKKLRILRLPNRSVFDLVGH
jgi:hypothetical protein